MHSPDLLQYDKLIDKFDTLLFDCDGVLWRVSGLYLLSISDADEHYRETSLFQAVKNSLTKSEKLANK